jgi:glutamate-1-semialdehyde 2,1-aminomutase
VPDSAGVPAGYTQYTLIAEYNSKESVAELFEKYHGQIAAIIVEPVAANMGVVPPQKEFLEFLRTITKDDGALLIFDEVITGFRLSLGGAQEYYGVTPDITTLGKIVGGGMPVGAYGGSREIMECVAPVGKVYQAGTLSGNPIAITAGIETIKILKENPGIYSKIEQTTKKLADAICDKFGDKVSINRAGSLMSVFFTDVDVVDMDTATTSNTKAYARYFRYMLENGVNLAPSQFEAMFISAAHTEEDVMKTIALINEYKI